MNAIWSMAYQLFGEFGASHMNLSLVQYIGEERITIVRCSHKALRNVRAVIAAVTKINDKRAVIHVVAISGTLKSLRKKITKPAV